MSKFSIILLLYAVVLLALFSTLCYLMTIVNPVPTKVERTRKLGADDFFYPNDVLLANDNVAFGLEKAGDEYYDDNDFEKYKSKKLSTVFKLRTEVTKATTDQNTKAEITTLSTSEDIKTNCTRKVDNDLDKTVTQSLRLPLRGLRRSINKENEQNFYMDSPNSLTLEIKVVDRQPKIEVKIMSLNEGEKNLRNQRSTNFKIITKGLFLNSTNIALDGKNNTVIQLGENDMLVINALNKYNYDNETILTEDSNLEKTDPKNFSLELENLYKINLLNDNADKQNVESITDQDITIKSSLGSTLTQNTDNL
ncbi:uncharacterized protein LOC124532431 [Vanessa cardui]|uniref:uncharacterized protein LOC124532431 n=1 Tax=Vanessa cardui TaxID=171605 RepID=UPI001F14424C|nr:uncharacterized protein LOC124532431 [Vanessa cardui]